MRKENSDKDIEMSHILFCGLGTMGAPMARHLLHAGHQVTVYNRSLDKSRQFAQKNDCDFLEQLTSNALQQLPQPVSHIILCVGKDDDVRQCLTQDPALLTACSDQAIIIDHTTTSADLAREMYAYAASFSVDYIDAPVSGGELGAVNGQLTVMAGGLPDAIARAQQICSLYSKNFTHMGASGSGQTTKMVNQICVAGLLGGLAEGINLAQSSGLDIDQVVDTLSGGAAGSWQMQHRGKTMAKGEFNFGFAIQHMLKDLAICQQHAQGQGLDLSLTQHVMQRYQTLLEQGHGMLDTSALILATAKRDR